MKRAFHRKIGILQVGVAYADFNRTQDGVIAYWDTQETSGLVAACFNPALALGRELLDESGGGTADKDNFTQGNNAALTNPSANLLRVARDGTNNPDARQAALIEDALYTISGEARSDGNATPDIRDNSGEIFGGTTSTDWQPFDFEYRQSGGTSIRFRSTTSTGTQYTEWRNLSIIQTDIAASSSFPGPQELDESGDGTADKDNYSPINSATLTNPSTNLLRVARNAVNDPGARQFIITVGKRYFVTSEARSDGNAIPRIQMSGSIAIDGTTSTNWQELNFELVVSSLFNATSFNVS